MVCQATVFPFFFPFSFWTMLSGTWLFWLSCPRLGVNTWSSWVPSSSGYCTIALWFSSGTVNPFSVLQQASFKALGQTPLQAKGSVSMAHLNPELILSRKPTVHELLWESSSWERAHTDRKRREPPARVQGHQRGRLPKVWKRTNSPSVCLLAGSCQVPFCEPQKPEFTRIPL